MKKKVWVFVLVGIILLILISVIGGYNSLVEREEEVDRTQSEVINRLNQRQDLIGQLIPTVVGLEEHAEEIYNKITEARKAFSNAKNTDNIEGMIEADALQVDSMNELIVIIEDNPDIHATDAYTNLMDNISAIESSLSQARRDYNNSVSDYNKAVRKFPKILYASLFGFEKEKLYWMKNDGADEIPQIDFNK